MNMDHDQIKDLLFDAVRRNYFEKVKFWVNSVGLSHCPEWLGGYALLCIAIKAGHLDLAKFLLIKGARTKCSEYHGRTLNPLVLEYCEEFHDNAVIPLVVENKWDQSLVELLLAKGSNIDARNGKSQTALHVATEKGNIHAVRFLLQNGAQVNAKDSSKMSPLQVACLQRHDCALYVSPNSKTRISKNKICTNVNSSLTLKAVLGFEPGTLPCKENNVEIVKVLCQNGADITIATPGQCFLPLHLASISKSVGIVRLLLDKGADPNAVSKNNLTPLLCSCKTVHSETEESTVEIVELLLSRSADVNSKDGNNRTALRIAVEKRSRSLVECILRHKPDVSDANNREALKSALCGFMGANVKIYRRLLEYGFSFSCEDANDIEFFHCAIKKGCVAMVRYLLSNGADLDSVQGNNTPLQSAVTYKQIEIVKVLLENGARVKDSVGLLHRAVRSRNYEMCKLLINEEVNVNAVDEKGLTAFHYTIDTRFLRFYDAIPRLHNDSIVEPKLFSLLLENGCAVNARGRKGRTILHEIADYRCKDHVDVLLEHGADINIIDDDNKTPLLLAAKKGCLKIVESLLNYGAEVNCGDSEGNTPLHCVFLRTVEKDEERDVYSKVLFPHGAEVKHVNYSEVVKVLLSHGADVNRINEYRETPLHLAVRLNNPENSDFLLKNTEADSEVVKVLLSHGAEVNNFNGNGETPLHLAVSNKSLDIMEILLKNGADVNLKSIEIEPLESNLEDCDAESTYSLEEYIATKVVGGTPLHYAAQGGEGYEVVADILLKNQADVNARSKSNATPLHLASATNEKMVEFLLKHGADINAVCHYGGSPLHFAAANGCTGVVKTLLEFDAFLDCKDKKGRTALHLAVIGQYLNTVKTLLDHGADSTAKTNCGNSVLCFTNRQQSEEEDKPPSVLVCLLEHTFKRLMLVICTAPYNISEDLTAFIILLQQDGIDVYERTEKKRLFLEEFKRIKETKLSCHMSLCDVLKKMNTNVLSRNKELIQSLESLDLKTFPHYGGMLECICKKVIQRSRLLVPSYKCLDFLVKISNKLNFNHLPVLPIELKDMIISLLTNRELKTFISCFEGMLAPKNLNLLNDS